MQQGLATKFVELLGMKNSLVKKEICRVLSILVAQNSPLLELYINLGVISKMLYIIRAGSKDVHHPQLSFLSNPHFQGYK